MSKNRKQKKPPPPPAEDQMPVFPPATSQFTCMAGFTFDRSDHPPEFGQHSIPLGKENCLKNCRFVITGTLRSLTRDMASRLINQYGGIVTAAISGKTNVILRGRFLVGPSKMKDAKRRRIQIIDEESLFQYLKNTNPNWVDEDESEGEVDDEAEDEIPHFLSEIDFPISSMLTEKYRPRSIKDIVGNNGSVNELHSFFQQFRENGKTKSALIVGQSGIGKSTAAALVSFLNGYRPIEYNASDIRSEKAIRENIGGSFSSQGIGYDFESEEICFIFDEVDGMSTGDRGGISELASQISSSRVPIVCICNEIDHKKMKEIINKSLQIVFYPISHELILKRLQTIVQEEKLDFEEDQLKHIADMAKGDLRLALNSLQFSSYGKDNFEMEKSIEITDVNKAVSFLMDSESKLETRFQAFFANYSLVPFYLYENAPFNNPRGWADTLESIAIGDTFDQEIHSANSWNLLSSYGFYSTVLPSTLCVDEKRHFLLKFPQIFARNKRKDRLSSSISSFHSRVCTSCLISSSTICSSFTFLILKKILSFLSGRKPKIELALDFMDELSMNYEDFLILEEIVVFGQSPLKKLTSQIKADLTKSYRKRHIDFKGKEKQNKSSNDEIKAQWMINKWDDDASKPRIGKAVKKRSPSRTSPRRRRK